MKSPTPGGEDAFGDAKLRARPDIEVFACGDLGLHTGKVLGYDS